jgi:hypothetical protein
LSGDARHAPRADRLDARLLDGIEDGAGLLALGRELRWMRRSWQARLRSAIESPRPRVIAISAATACFGRLRQAGAITGQRRAVVGEGDLQFAITGDGAHAAGYRALEGSMSASGPGFEFAASAMTCRRDRHRVASGPARRWRLTSGSSSPKARW